MPRRLFRICPQQLQPGMFIAEVDRPWLETPLPFQSFFIRDLSDIQWIRENCAFVVVDSEYSDRSLVFDYHAADAKQAKLAKQKSSGLLREVQVQRTSPDAWATHAEAVVSSVPHKRRFGTTFKQIFLPARRTAPGPAPTGQQLIKTKVAQANETYQSAKVVLHHVLDELRTGGQLDVTAVEKVVGPVIDSVLQNTDAMACVVRMKNTDSYIYNHSLATSIWAVVFGKALGFDKPNLEILGMGGMLLDIGKTRIPRELLEKPGELTPDERAKMRLHVQHGIDILKEAGNISPKVAEMVRTHHERHDGSGYPAGLAGQAIPLLGRIAGLVDTYDAMTSVRPMAPARSTFHAMQSLLDQSDVMFQGELVERFIQVVGIFPTASLVELNGGEVAIVVEQNSFRRLRPKVMMILDAEKNMRNEFPVLDLAEVSADTTEEGSKWIVQGLEPGSFGIDPREYYL
jgi:HD-GYP domain-containing protein (c-di-GMP phosphodiesterase class II)